MNKIRLTLLSLKKEKSYTTLYQDYTHTDFFNKFKKIIYIKFNG